MRKLLEILFDCFRLDQKVKIKIGGNTYENFALMSVDDEVWIVVNE